MKHNVELTKEQAIQLGHLAQRGGVDSINVSHETWFSVRLSLRNDEGVLLSTVVLHDDGHVISDSQVDKLKRENWRTETKYGPKGSNY